MKKSEAMFGVLRVPMDALSVLAALLLAYRLREARIDLLPGVQLLEPATTLPQLGHYVDTFVFPSVLAFLVIAAFLRLYSLGSTLSAWSEVGRLILASTLWLVCIIGWFFLVEKELFYSRILLVHAVFFIFLFSIIGRVSLLLLQRSFLRLDVGRHLVVSVGLQPLSLIAKQFLEHDIRYRYLGHIQNLESLRRIAHSHQLDLALQTDPNPNSTETHTLIDYCRSHHIGYGYLPPVLADVPHQLRVERLGLVPIVRFQPTPLDGWGRVLKRIFDLVTAALLLVLISPLLLLIALAVVVDSGFPIFYISRRLGEQGRKQIHIYKFRSMIKNADQEKEHLLPMNHRTDGPLFKIKNDPRVTRVGKVLRRWTFDELPQLINVFFGRMSLVGPRPHLPEEVARYSQIERRVFAVKPGITGLAQISGRSDLKFEDEVRLDLQYIEEWSLLFDLWILWRTFFTVLSRKGAD